MSPASPIRTISSPARPASSPGELALAALDALERGWRQASSTPPDARITGLRACPGLALELIENTKTCDKQTITAREDSDDEFLGLCSPRPPGAAGDDASKQDVNEANDSSSQTGYSSLMLAQCLTSKKYEK